MWIMAGLWTTQALRAYSQLHIAGLSSVTHTRVSWIPESVTRPRRMELNKCKLSLTIVFVQILSVTIWKPISVRLGFVNIFMKINEQIIAIFTAQWQWMSTIQQKKQLYNTKWISENHNSPLASRFSNHIKEFISYVAHDQSINQSISTNHLHKNDQWLTNKVKK